MPVLPSQYRNEIGNYHNKLQDSYSKCDRHISNSSSVNSMNPDVHHVGHALRMAVNTSVELSGARSPEPIKKGRKANFINLLMFLGHVNSADIRAHRGKDIIAENKNSIQSNIQDAALSDYMPHVNVNVDINTNNYERSGLRTSKSYSNYEGKKHETGEIPGDEKIKTEWHFALPAVDASALPPEEGVIKNDSENYYQITSENKMEELITALQEEMINSGKISKEDGENFKYYLRQTAAGQPGFFASLDNNDVVSGKKGFGQCDFVEEVVNDFGEVIGLVITFQGKNGDTILNNVLNSAANSKKNPVRKDDKTTAQIMILGLNVNIGKLIIDAKRDSYKKNFDDEYCHTDSRQFPVAGLARATDLDVYMLERKTETKNKLNKPAELKKMLPEDNIAAYYMRDPHSRIRTEIILEIEGDKKMKSEGGKVYLKPTGIHNEYITYHQSGSDIRHTQKKVIFNPEEPSWYFKKDLSKNKLEVKVKEGKKQLNLYGDYYDIFEAADNNLVIGFINEIGIREYLPIYREPVSGEWFLDKLYGHAAFTHDQEEVINNSKVDIDKKATYRIFGNNNPHLYGDAKLYEQVNTLSRKLNIIEIKGALVPVRAVKHDGQGVLYEIYNAEKIEEKGYPVEWSGGRWIFEEQHSIHISQSLNEIVTSEMLTDDIDKSQLSAPDDQGLRKASNGDVFIKANNAFLKINEEDGKYFVNGVKGDKIYLEYRKDQFTPAADNKDTFEKNPIKKRSEVDILNNECPSWQTLYDELDHLAQKDQVMSVRHRGDLDNNIAENSLSAFRQSYKKCRVAIETDVLTTKDGEMVIFHDARIGKMMEPSYHPERNTGPNEFLKDKTLAELKEKRLLNPQREPTEDTIITVQELLEDYISQKGQSQFYLEVKDPQAILRVAKVLYEKSLSHPGLLERIIIKFNMAEFPTPEKWYEALKKMGIKSIVMANPVMSPFAAKRINALPYDLPDPPDMKLYDNASRAVYAWSNTPAAGVPNVEVVIKSSKDGFINTVTKDSPQGKYKKPVSLDMSNTVPGSPAYWVSIVKKYHKPLGTYVPVADRVMWKDGIIAGITVPNVNQKDKQIDITKAYYNNDSRCCYSLDDKLAKHETEDSRENLEWNRGIGANIITSDDTDSIDTYYDKLGQLDKTAMPNPRYPLAEMHSTLAWDLGYYKRPIYNAVNIKAWNGARSAWWGSSLFNPSQVCLWDNPYKLYPWLYRCDASQLYNYYNNLQLKAVKTKSFGDATQIYSHDKSYCLSAKDGYSSYYKMTENCHPDNTETHFHYTSYKHLRALYFGAETTYTEFYKDGYYYRIPYGVLSATKKQPDSWGEWDIESVKG